MINNYRNPNDSKAASRRNGYVPAYAPVLVVEPNLADAKHLVSCLTRLRQPVRLAMSAADAIDALRREVFDRVVVAAEMTLDGEPLLDRLARLPMLRRIVAIGPAGDADLEVRARTAGAHVYMTRPAGQDELARALAVPGHADTRA
jgi:CheY-like chemotaxis protein